MSTATDADWTPNFGGVSLPAPNWPARRPTRIAILGDFGAGALKGRLDTGQDLARRKPLKVEFDTLDAALGRVGLSLTLPIGADGAPVEVAVAELEGFHPDELYRNVEVFSALAALRKQLNNASTFASAAARLAQMGIEGGLRSASSVSRSGSARGASLSRGARLDDFARLTGRSSIASGTEPSIEALLRNIVGPFVVASANPKKEALLSSVDLALTDAMRAVLHQGDFQNTESLWRGVDFLLRRIETSHSLQVHLFDISAEEFAADLSAVDDLADSGLYKLLVEQPSQDADGGYAYLAGCYSFDATPPQAELLGRAARVAAHAGAPFLTSIATAGFTDRREPPHRLIRDAFAALREMSDASFLGLIGPRFLLRHPYGKRSDPIQTFSFEEFSPESGLRGMLWAHPALLALTVLATPGGQLTIDDLPFHHVVDKDGDSVALPCTDRLVNTSAATLLRDVGINAVMAHKGEARVRLSGLEAVNGDGLASAAAPTRKASNSRVAIGSRDAAEVVARWSAPARKAGGPGATASAAPDAVDADDATQDLASEPAGAGQPEIAAAQDSGQDSGQEAEAATGEAAVDDELAALLASLDAPAAEGSAAQANASEEEEGMDPDLAALLKELG